MTYRVISSLQFACSRTIVSCIGTFIHCKTVSFCRTLGGQLANEVQCCQMSPYESDLALLTQTNHSRLHSASANIGKRSVRKISWYNSITITVNMDWGQHISDISSKATNTLGFLRRNLAFAPGSTKEVAYKTLVRPKLEYVAPIWSPNCKTQIQQMEKVKMAAAHWTCRRWRNTSSFGEMLNELQWPTLEARRDQSSLLFFYKIHCGIILCLLIKTTT